MKSKILIGGIFVAALATFLGWYFLSPLITLNGIKSALEKKNGKAVGTFVDFEALKSDLKSDLNLAIMGEMEKDSSAMAGMGAAIGMAVINPMIDAMVSPAGITKLLKESPSVNEEANSDGLPNAKQIDENYKIERVSISKFRLATKDAKGTGLVFERRGLGWKVTGIDLPPTPSAPSTPAN